MALPLRPLIRRGSLGLRWTAVVRARSGFLI
jgi:hypothetical protein